MRRLSRKRVYFHRHAVLADSGGAGTCRDQISIANLFSGLTITFKSGLGGTITLESALPHIGVTMSIEGPGASVIAINGAGEYRIFDVEALGGTISISGLTIENGSDKADNYGGAAINVGSPICK